MLLALALVAVAAGLLIARRRRQVSGGAGSAKPQKQGMHPSSVNMAYLLSAPLSLYQHKWGKLSHTSEEQDRCHEKAQTSTCMHSTSCEGAADYWRCAEKT